MNKFIFFLLLSLTSYGCTENNQGLETRYMKLSSSGETVAPKDGPWSCVKDVKTSLVWEVKSYQENLQHYNSFFSFYDGDPKIGRKKGGSCKIGNDITDCDSLELVNYVNQKKLCGFSNWRIPTIEELLSLRWEPSIKDKVFVNPYYFPRTTKNIYLSSSVIEKNGKHKIGVIDYLSMSVDYRDFPIVGNLRLVATAP